MPTVIRITSMLALAPLVALPLVGCPDDGGQTGGETHWQRSFLAGCVSDAQCSEALVCIDHVCSQTCHGDADCDLAADDYCDASGHCVVAGRVSCTSATSCDADHEGWLCDASVVDPCRTDVTVCRSGAWVDGSIDTCRAQLGAVAAADTFVVVRAETVQPVDVLVVVDDSTSMIDERVGFGGAFSAFTDALQARGVGDVHLAATGVDMGCEASSAERVVAQGLFNRWPASVAPFVGRDGVIDACAGDDDCPSSWQCLGAGAGPACTTNPNGTINSTCAPTCADDGDCTVALGEGYHCVEIGTDSGCVRALDGCPSEVPAVVSGELLGGARCLVRLNDNPRACFSVESPLAAMRAALDPSGVNAADVDGITRAGAVLAVITLGDEDDCSLAAGESLEDLEQYTCALLGDTNDDGPLEPVATFTSFLKGSKPPGRSFFAALGGDSIAADEAARDAAREAYVSSKLDGQQCHTNTTICATPDARDSADWTPRLYAAAAAMGIDSHSENLCALGTWPDALARTADAVADTAMRICLPHAPGAGGLQVDRLIGNETTTLLEAPGGPHSWHRVSGAAECASGEAIVLVDPPSEDEIVRVSFLP